MEDSSKTAFFTTTASDVGYALADEYARRAFTIYSLDRPKESHPNIHHLQPGLAGRNLDACNTVDLERAFKTIKGSIDHVVLSDLIAAEPSNKEELPHFYKIIHGRNVTAPFYVSMAVRPRLSEDPTFVFINHMDGLNKPSESPLTNSFAQRTLLAYMIDKLEPKVSVKIAYLPPSLQQENDQPSHPTRDALTADYFSSQVMRLLDSRERDLIFGGGDLWEYACMTLTPSTGFKDPMLDPRYANRPVLHHPMD